MLVPLLIAAVAGYLLGSLPFGFLVARAKGVNIFEVGSKNPGATNVRRVLGHGPGNLVLFLDALKGAVAVGWIPLFLFLAGSSCDCGADLNRYQMITGLVAALLGHSFSCFTQFRGGKGVATGAGGFLVLFPLGALVGAIVWGTTVALTRYVSLASMLAALTLPFTAFFLHQPALITGLSVVVALFVILRHRANLTRLLSGTESKMGTKKTDPADPTK